VAQPARSAAGGGAWFAGVCGTLGKFANDFSLLMQTEVAEVGEPVAEGRGGSSTMPHKRNPVACAAILTAAQRTPGLVATLYASQIQQHERALGGWQAEWETLPELITLVGGALAQSGAGARHAGLPAENARRSRYHPRADYGRGGDSGAGGIHWQSRGASSY
jgi:3-carboxy-cis,cis-muconate cycloisomerase